jgi:hypothetical protein
LGRQADFNTRLLAAGEYVALACRIVREV